MKWLKSKLAGLFFWLVELANTPEWEDVWAAIAISLEFDIKTGLFEDTATPFDYPDDPDDYYGRQDEFLEALEDSHYDGERELREEYSEHGLDYDECMEGVNPPTYGGIAW